MDREQRERLALWWLLAALVLTGGATAAWRLAFVALPLLLFCLSLRWYFLALGLVALPSLLELSIHGDWVGSLGGRIRLATGALVFLCAVGLGVRLKAQRSLRHDLVTALPWFAAGLLTQALLRLFELIPPQWQYLSGNHLSALITAMLVPTLALRMPSLFRALSLGLLVTALLVTGSRWGIWIGLTFGSLMVASVNRGKLRVGALIGLGVLLLAPWIAWSQLDLEKGGFLRALSGLSGLRPWTGLGHGGAEHLSLQFVERTARLTHIESLPFDWASIWGWPLAIALLIALFGIAFYSAYQSKGHTVERLSWLAGVGLLALVMHDLFDFSMTSGALTVALGILVGLRLRLSDDQVGNRVTTALVGALLVLGLGSAHYLDPLIMEREGRLESISEVYGERSFRYWINKARRADSPARQVEYYSKALAIAPGYRDAWFELGDAIGRAGWVDQALLAYQRGLSAAKNDWTGSQSNALARLPVSMIPRAIGSHKGAARSVALFRSKGDEQSLKLVQMLDRKHRDPLIRKWFLSGLLRTQNENRVVVPMLWSISQEPPVNEGDGITALLEIIRREPRVDGAALLLRMVQSQPNHCLGLGQWPDDQLVDLYRLSGPLNKVCQQIVLGRGEDLRVLSQLRDVGLEAP